MDKTISGLTSRNQDTRDGLSEFVFNGSPIRVLGTADHPLFVAKDVCDVLGYTNARKTVADHVPEKHRDTVTIRDGITAGNPNTTVITEAGLYRLIFASKMPAAEAFTDWVCTEVLPALRREGVYEVAGHPARLPVEKLRLRLEAAELKARARALEITADRLTLPAAPAGHRTIGEHLAAHGYTPGSPGYLSACARLGNALRGAPCGWTRGRDRKPRRAFAPEVFAAADVTLAPLEA